MRPKGIVIGFVGVFFVVPVAVGVLKGHKDYKDKIVAEAWKLYEEGSYTLALEKAEPLAEKNCDAADLAGILYLNGEGCDVDLEKAFKYFSLGQDKNMEAKTNYALLLLQVKGCEQDLELGQRQLLDAANIGKNTLAIMRLGELQVTGDYGFAKNIEQGMRNLRIAMDAGSPYAAYLVGLMQYNGAEGVAQNKEKGLELLKKAAEAGVLEAVEFLETRQDQATDA